MITVHLRYVIDPYRLRDFEEYGRRWTVLVNELGGNHLGYFMPSEGANNIAYALVNFPTLSAYETYRSTAADDERCQEVMALAETSRCILSYERTFMRPLDHGQNLG